MLHFTSLTLNIIIIFNIIFLLMIVFFERRRPIYTLFWISLLIFTPVLGLILFLLFGISWQKLRKKINFKNKQDIDDDGSQIYFSKFPNTKYRHFINYLEGTNSGKLCSYTDMKVLAHGTEFFPSLFNDIKNAKKSILIEYFIFQNDSLGTELYNLMLEKKREGLEVKLILDGGKQLSYDKLRELEKTGVEIEVLFPSIFSFTKLVNLRINNRNHRKLTIIDCEIGYIGGFNIGDEYIGKGKLGDWRDTAIRFEGNIVREFGKEFVYFWNFLSTKKTEKMCPSKFIQNNNEKENNSKKGVVQLVSGGPYFEFKTVRDNMLMMIASAKKNIKIQTPYFIPDEMTTEALKIAALSGVKIEIIIPDRADHFFVYWINQSFAWELLNLNVHFYRYQKGFLHSKVVIIDDEMATVGSSNFDTRSFYSNFELNVNLYANEFGGEEIKELIKNFYEDKSNSIKISNKDYGNRNILVKVKESVFRLLSPLL